jgi:small-conductance mechanosensitive channel
MSAHGSFVDAVLAWAPLLLLVAAAIVIGYLFEKLVLQVARAMVRRTDTTVDDIVYRALHPAILLVVVLATFWVGVDLLGSRIPGRGLDLLVAISVGLFIALGAFIAARLLRGILQLRARSRVEWQPVASLGSRIGSVVVYVAAFLMILNEYGLDVTPLLTTAGLAALAVALALQDTLANFFAGVWMQTGKAMRPGHFVRIEEYQIQGYVVEIGWRTTKIRDLGNFMYVMPNSKVAQSLVVDYYLPVTRMAFNLDIIVAYESDLDQVERICLEEARKGAKDVPGLLDDPEPTFKWIPGFGEYAIQGRLGLQIREFVDQYQIQHELRKRILKRFRQEGIRIPARETMPVPE